MAMGSEPCTCGAYSILIDDIIDTNATSIWTNPFDAEREAALGMGQLVAAQQGKGPYFFSTFSLGNRSTLFFFLHFLSWKHSRYSKISDNSLHFYILF